MIAPRTSHKFFRQLSNFVPQHNPIDKESQRKFSEFLQNFKNILVLTGAGVSTESGIPDYRSKDVGMFASKSYKPIQYSDFIKNPKARQRYWARNFVGWPKFSTIPPNKVHFDLSKLECELFKISAIVTQNVDGLHSKAGSDNVVELHGNAYWVKCVQCGTYISRHSFQSQLKELNPEWDVDSHDLRPDGDVEINPEKIEEFVVPECKECGGIFKPTIVFFGENIPEKRVKRVEKLVEDCDALLILGTSLSTLSSYRILIQAFELCKFVCIVNIGSTRGDKYADLLINCKCSDVFPKLRKESTLW